ncbi:Down syndrome critical region protein 3, variant 2 [Dermatophagoides farinae]|uniref:Down syndrome critical region protein 3, variant 2 n=1 Tax=Dermatophagoides farinae TaxID=6954 RepID=A0A922KUF6_DERFA|nr:Down syndrome critical region protein 3, variant 2 [Dermatophagoides farinae]
MLTAGGGGGGIVGMVEDAAAGTIIGAIIGAATAAVVGALIVIGLLQRYWPFIASIAASDASKLAKLMNA